MEIYSNLELLTGYLLDAHFDVIYKEPNFPLDINSNFVVAHENTASYLTNAATVGNRTLGLYNHLPEIPSGLKARSLYVFIGLNPPLTINCPVFYCRDGDSLYKTLPKAFKMSIDVGVPVQVVIAANTLYNYSSKKIPPVELDRVAPYVSSKPLPSNNENGQKLTSFFQQYSSEMSREDNKGYISFYDEAGWWPEFIFPPNSSQDIFENQKKWFVDFTTITSTDRDKPLVRMLLNTLNLAEIVLETKIYKEEKPAATYLCPGCPFPMIFNDGQLDNKVVYTSIYCHAAHELFALQYKSFTEFAGLNHSKLNTTTVFIGNLSDYTEGLITEAGQSQSQIILLKDIEEKSPFPVNKKPFKLKVSKNITFPYSCNNIIKYKPPKFSARKRKCKESIVPDCISKSKCQAILYQPEGISIDKDLCSGCLRCVKSCCGALS